jgi:hypothetical protein
MRNPDLAFWAGQPWGIVELKPKVEKCLESPRLTVLFKHSIKCAGVRKFVLKKLSNSNIYLSLLRLKFPGITDQDHNAFQLDIFRTNHTRTNTNS